MIATLYEPFRHWSEGGSVYILSDLHFSDSDCKLMDPNWITPEEQLEIINKRVFKSDTFVCLGDVGDPKYVPIIKAGKRSCFWETMMREEHIRIFLMKYIRVRSLSQIRYCYRMSRCTV